MAGAYSVTISAKDLASGAFDAANKRLAAFNKRVAEATAPARRFAETLETFSKVTGLTEIATGFSSVGRAGTEAFRSLSRIVEPLAAIIGVGSIAGVYRLATAWGELSNALGNQAQRAGVSASQLFVLQNAARLAGVDAETLTSGVTALNDGLRNAQFGGNPALLNVLANLHLNLEDLQKMDAPTRLKAIADALQNVHGPVDKALDVKTIFGGEGLLQFLNKGAAGITNLVDEAKKLGGTGPNVAAGQAFFKAQQGLAESITGIGNSVANVLGPALTPVLADVTGMAVHMREWLDATREWLQHTVSEEVGKFVGWLKAVDWNAIGGDMREIAVKAQAVADALGGWERVGEGVVVFIAGSWLLRMAAPFASLSLAVAQLTFAIGKTLVAGYVAAGDAAVAFEAKAGAAMATASKVGRLGAGLGVAALGWEGADLLGSATQPKGDGIANLLHNILFDVNPLHWTQSYHPDADGGGSRTPASQLFYSGADQTQGGGNARNMRNNNPTNLSFAGQPGATSDGRFAHFQNMESGVAADLNQFLLYQDREGQRSIADMIHKASPASDNPGVEGYIDRVATQMGMRRDEVPDLHNRDVARRFIMAVAPNEGGTPDGDAVQRGVDLRLGPAAALPSASGAGLPGTPGANGRVDLNVRVNGNTPTTVTGRSTGGVDLYVAQPGLLGAQ